MIELPQNIKTVFETSTCLYTRAEVEAAFDAMAAKINARLADTNPIFICVLLGGIIPLGNLLPRLDFPLELDYVHATRYQGKTSGGHLTWEVKLRKSLSNRTVVIVDDLLDAGLTLRAIVDFCREEGAKDVFTVVLADKKDARDVKGLNKADFTGLDIPNRYVFGYGMDYQEYFRNAPGIYAIAQEYEKNK